MDWKAVTADACRLLGGLLGDSATTSRSSFVPRKSRSLPLMHRLGSFLTVVLQDNFNSDIFFWLWLLLEKMDELGVQLAPLLLPASDEPSTDADDDAQRFHAMGSQLVVLNIEGPSRLSAALRRMLRLLPSLLRTSTVTACSICSTFFA